MIGYKWNFKTTALFNSSKRGISSIGFKNLLQWHIRKLGRRFLRSVRSSATMKSSTSFLSVLSISVLAATVNCAAVSTRRMLEFILPLICAPNNSLQALFPGNIQLIPPGKQHYIQLKLSRQRQTIRKLSERKYGSGLMRFLVLKYIVSVRIPSIPLLTYSRIRV
jgi:hypothetical protein